MPYLRNTGHSLVTALALTGLLALPAPVTAQSLLEAVLSALQKFEGGTPSLMANIAVNGSYSRSIAPVLAEGDLVIVGYDRLDNPLYATAGPDGLVISSAVASAEASGLPAGTYPLGTELYATTDGGWAIYGASATGVALPLANLAQRRIDGSIRIAQTNLISDPNIAGSKSLETLWGAIVETGGMTAAVTTALGAVNAGQLVTAVSVELSSNVIGSTSGIEGATIAQGADSRYISAVANRNQALLSTVSQLGGATTPLAAVNIAANLATTEGAINLQISRASARVGALVTTTIGAINSGSINGSPP